MAINVLHNAFVDQASITTALSKMVGVTPGANNPAYLVLTALDRNEYTAGSTGATGCFIGNGKTLAFSGIGGDGRGTGLVFTYQAASGRYYNSVYGYLDELVYKSSSNRNDVTNISLFGTSNLSLANQYASNAWYAMQISAFNYLGSVTVATQPAFAGPVPDQATPMSIAAVASSFVGKAWNMNGCWVLASTIAAEAGASLPLRSTAIGLAGQANGEWVVAFNGPAGQTGAWQQMVTAGEIVVFGFAGGGGHITTCVSGSGSSAMLVDNITYVNGNGTVANPANDGSASDILIAPPHPASHEWASAIASTVVIYQLDTPIVTAKVSSVSLTCGMSLSLYTLFSVSDPAGRPITKWQVYDTAASDWLVCNGASTSNHAASTALEVGSLSPVSLLAGSVAVTDTIGVRAYNGSYWGDWQTLTVAVTTSAVAAPRAPSAPVVTNQTAAQTWLAGQSLSLTLPANTFTDPDQQALSYAATLSSGAALPSWLKFNAATDTFTGIVPSVAQKLTLSVKATDTSGLSATDTFAVTVIGAPTVTAQTPMQNWVVGQKVNLALPGNTFTDPQGQKLTYTASLASGAALPSWLQFNGATDTFTGTAPSVAQAMNIKVTATDASGLSASETFTAAVKPGIAVANPIPDQTWLNNRALNVVLPGNTFTDSLGLKMSFAAYQVSGPSVTSWLRFNGSSLTFSGAVPATQSGTIGLAILATDAARCSATDMFQVSFATAASGQVHAEIQSVASALYDPYDQTQLQGLIPLER
ncbi:MAG: putative Ig domain-containing protein [Proteobacteria bacterium]|nr:putative Ig domain-containing protein [Pseudomonadota bacterium]